MPPSNPSKSAAATDADADLVAIDQAPFIMRACGAGAVVAIASDENFTGRAFPWAWLFNTLGPQRWQWCNRYGLSLDRENADFWNFLIPGVGLAPVGKFQVLITLFMLAIGPVNYLLLRRWGKLNLMSLTVPAGATVVTLGLVGFAVFADGLGVRLRRVVSRPSTSARAPPPAKLAYRITPA